MSESTEGGGPSLARLVASTPPDRDRFVDFIRGASILVVILGHWTVSVILYDGDTVTATNVLGTARWLQWATWLVQVMPLFFFVGGFSNLRAITHEQREGLGYADYLRRRLARLMRPTLVFVVAWMLAAAALDATTLDHDTVHLVGSLAAQPLWFLAVYLIVVALAPPMAAVHRRHPVLPIVLLVGVVGSLDVARFHGDPGGLSFGNYVLVFLFAQQLGFFYGDGRLTRWSGRSLLAISASAFALLAVLTTVGPYPTSMVGVPGEELSNMSPPTWCVIVLTLAQVSLVMALRPAANRWLQRRRVWTATVAVNSRIMTLFLWHLTALALAAVVLVLILGFPTPAAAAAGWWWSRPVWIAAALVVLAVFVAAFGWAEQPRPARTASRTGPAAAVVGLLLVVRGLIGLALNGFSRLLDAPGRSFLGLALSPLANTVLIVVGYLLVQGVGIRGLRARSRDPAATPTHH